VSTSLTSTMASCHTKGGLASTRSSAVSVLERELADVEKRAQALGAEELPPLNQKLKAAGLREIAQADAVEAGQELFAARTLEEALEGAQEQEATTRRREHD